MEFSDSSSPKIAAPAKRNPKVQPGAKETAQYISDIVLELRNMATAQGMKTLQGLLEVTFYEAFSMANKIEVPAEEIERLRQLSKASAG